MAASDELNKATEASKKTREELEGVIDAVVNIGAKIQEAIADAIDEAQGLDDIGQKIAKSYGRDIVGGLKKMTTSFDRQLALQTKLNKGQNISKELAKEKEKQAAAEEVIQTRINLLDVNDLELKKKLQDELETVKLTGRSIISDLEQQNTKLIAQRGLGGNILENAKEYLISLDKSGLAAELLNGNLDGAQKAALIGEAALIAIAKATLAGSNNINNLQKNLGISYGSAYQLQNSLKATSNSADKLFITSTDLNKSFTDLVETTGLISDFGGDTLVTMTALTKQLGLGTAEASQLALLARTQGTDTESILENTVKTVNAVNRQNGAAISAKAVLNDVATASKAIVVSLGMSPEILAEAATEARTLGLSLSQVDNIAGSLLDFESSIENELAFQMLTGKEINLDKARQLALDNDLLGLGKEIGENAEITEAFATGSRIQQEAAAAALGISREEMANMVYQQGIQNLQKDEFIAKFGEQNYLQMQSMSASQKFEASMEKIKGVITDIGTIFAPIVDMFASVLGYLAKSEIVIYAITGALGAMAAKQAFAASKSIITAVGSIFTSAFKMNPILGIALAGAGIGALYGAVSKAQSVKDGIAPSDRGPFTITDSYGAMATTTAGDSLMASPNVGKGGGGNSGEMVSLLKTIANKNSDVYMDSSKVGYADALSYSKL
mgnify:CR=1 FL=1